VARGLTPLADGWSGDVLANIDWTQPWFSPWRRLGQPSAQAALLSRSVAQALNSLHTSDTQAVRFVPQTELPAGEAYEAFIGRTQQVPTRDGLHDFFNGLCWARFPHTKRRLNALQATEIARHGIQARRGPVRDALTLFDENAILLQAPDSVWHALQARDWHRVFVDLREAWQDVHVVLFGHALLEKLVSPYKSITGHVWRLASSVPVHDEAALDAWLAQDLTAEKLALKPFEPLPVLGIPHWWADNASPTFYDDTQVFRQRTAASEGNPAKPLTTIG
jgi:hypothetical protein